MCSCFSICQSEEVFPLSFVLLLKTALTVNVCKILEAVTSCTIKSHLYRLEVLGSFRVCCFYLEEHF